MTWLLQHYVVVVCYLRLLLFHCVVGFIWLTDINFCCWLHWCRMLDPSEEVDLCFWSMQHLTCAASCGCQQQQHCCAWHAA